MRTTFFSLSPVDSVRVLWGRKRLIGFVILCATAAAVAINLLAPKRYTATVSVVVDNRNIDPLNDTPTVPQPLVNYLATQAEIIASRNVADKVARALHGSPDGADRLLKALRVETSTNSNVIHISYRSADPQTAARTANAFADAYIRTSLELQVDPAKRHAEWFEQQLTQLRQDLTDAQARLSAYQREHNILDVDEHRLDVENARLQEIATHLVNAQATLVDAEARAAQLARARHVESVDDVPDLANQPLLQNLKAELARAESKLAEVSERFDRNHPQHKSAAAEVAALRSRLATEIANVKESMLRAVQIARAQVKQTQSALDEQRARIIALSQQRDALAVLNRDVQSARAAYDAALQQTTHSRLQSRVDRTNIAILNPATTPTKPSSPKPLLNLLLGVLVGAVAGAAAALYSESLRPRVRSADTFAGLQIDLLAHLPPVPALELRELRTAPRRLEQAQVA